MLRKTVKSKMKFDPNILAEKLYKAGFRVNEDDETNAILMHSAGDDLEDLYGTLIAYKDELQNDGFRTVTCYDMTFKVHQLTTVRELVEMRNRYLKKSIEVFPQDEAVITGTAFEIEQAVQKIVNRITNDIVVKVQESEGNRTTGVLTAEQSEYYGKLSITVSIAVSIKNIEVEFLKLESDNTFDSSTVSGFFVDRRTYTYTVNKKVVEDKIILKIKEK